MSKVIIFSILAIGITLAASSSIAAAEKMSAEDAWKALPKYQYGQDMSALLTIDAEIVGAMASPTGRAACAARLAAVLEARDSTLAAKQYACLQLRQVGGSAEIPTLAKLLVKPETSQMARYALESIPGEGSMAALRESFGALKGELLIGLINSIAARKDSHSVAKLMELSDVADRRIAAAAFWALSNIANPDAVAFIARKAKQATRPMPCDMAVAWLRCAAAQVAAGNTEQAQSIYMELSDVNQTKGVRRAALEGILRLKRDDMSATIMNWIADPDADRRLVAAGRLMALSNRQLDQLADRLADLPDDVQLGLFEVLIVRKGKGVLPLVLSAVKSNRPNLRLTGLRALGRIGDASTICILVDALGKSGEQAEAAKDAFCQFPHEVAGKAMLAVMKERPDIRTEAIEVVKLIKYHEAIDPLIAVAAAADNPAVYESALDALRETADPDARDISRLLALLLKARDDKHREAVERTIILVCSKAPPTTDRAAPVWTALAEVPPSEATKYLPLVGRLGGPKALKTIDAALGDQDFKVRQAATRALCNWPDAEVADRLWKLAVSGDNECRSRALRAYIRVVTLKSDRPEADTLTMLQKAMERAENVEDRRWVLNRASTVRSMDAVVWIGEYLGNPELAQTACQVIVELAHHRFLRQPNMDRFGPLLDKVSRISKNPDVVERAKKYRLGL